MVKDGVFSGLDITGFVRWASGICLNLSFLSANPRLAKASACVF